MNTRPLFVFELHVEYSALEKSFDLNPLLKNEMHILLEKEGRCVDVLVLYQVVDDEVNSSDLIVSKCIVNCRSVKVLIITSLSSLIKISDFFILDDVTLLDLILIKEWEVAPKMLCKQLRQQVLHGPALE